LPKVLEILKKRWPEAILVVTLMAGVIVLSQQVIRVSEQSAKPGGGELPFGAAFMLGMGSMALIVIWQMLYLGLLASAYTNGCQRQEPIDLVKIGKYYFWRIIRFQIVLGILYISVSVVITVILHAVISGSQVKTVSALTSNLASFLTLICLVKPTLLTPAVIIVSDCNVRPALGQLKKHNILGEKKLLGVFGIYLIIHPVFLLITDAAEAGNFVTGLEAFILSSLTLVLALSATG